MIIMVVDNHTSYLSTSLSCYTWAHSLIKITQLTFWNFQSYQQKTLYNLLKCFSGLLRLDMKLQFLNYLNSINIQSYKSKNRRKQLTYLCEEGGLGPISEISFVKTYLNITDINTQTEKLYDYTNIYSIIIYIGCI